MPLSRPCSCTIPDGSRSACRPRRAAPWAAGSAPLARCGFTRHLQRGGDRRAGGGGQRERPGPDRLTNVVFMGMGEPLANYDRVWAAIVTLHDDLGFSARHLTVSTVGVVPGIRRLAAERLPVNLAVSLHAANDRLRDRLVPLNRRWPALRAAAGMRGLPVRQGPAPVLRVGPHRLRQRRPRRRSRAGGVGPSARRPRQPDPSQPHTRLSGPGNPARGGAGLSRRARRPRRQRHHPAQPGCRHRRRLWPAGRPRRDVAIAGARRSAPGQRRLDAHNRPGR